MNHRFYAVGSIIEWEKVLSLVAGGNYAVVATHNCTWNQVQGNSCVLIASLLHRPREQVPGAGGTSGRQRRCRSRTWLPRPPSPSSPPASLTPPISTCFFYFYSSYFSSTISASHITVQNWCRSILSSAGLFLKDSQRHNEPTSINAFVEKRAQQLQQAVPF